MNYFFYVRDKYLSNTLIRFFLHVVYFASDILEKEKFVFWEEDIYIDDTVLTLCENYLDYKVIPLVYKNYDSNNVINLINLRNLKDNVMFVLENFSKQGLLSLNNVQNKLAIFFKGHGSESLYSVLSWTRYYIHNGIKGISSSPKEYQDYINTYLMPGLKYWGEFNEKYVKYRAFLILCGFGEEMEKVFYQIEKFNRFINKISNFNKNVILQISLTELKDNIQSVDKIEEYLAKIEKKVNEFKNEI